MKHLLATILLIFSIVSLSHADDDDWFTNIEDAVTEAKAKDKLIMLKFTGSDWCPPCKMIHEAVFSKKEFIDQAKEKFILCMIDSPEQDKELAAKNKPLLHQYKIAGFPTMLLLDVDGEEFTRFNPSAFAEVQKMLDQLNYQIRRKDMF